MTARGNLRAGLGVLALLVWAPLVAGCSGGDDDDGADAAEARDPEAVEVVRQGLVDYPRADFRDDDQVRCVAEEIVDRLGAERLEELGLDVEAGTAPELFAPHLTEPERDQVSRAYDTCLDLVARDVESFTGEGLTEEQALCVSRAYRDSGVPRSHQTEPPHSDDLASESDQVRQAHLLLDEFLTAAKALCQAWLPPGTSPGEFRPSPPARSRRHGHGHGDGRSYSTG